jgi:predicted phage tail protein
MGPLAVSDVTAHTCHLDWKPPKDDGGDPVKYYIVEKMDTEKGIWVPCGETNGKTPEFDVEGLNEGCTYMFRVKAVNNEGESEPLETDCLTLAKNPFDRPGPPENVTIEDYDRKWVKLSWVKPKFDGGAKITHYIIEKKEDISSKYLKAMETDTDECFAKVTDLTENSKYRFRVKAVNKAGIGPPSEPSEEVTCKLRNAPPVIDRTNLDHIRVRIGEPIKLDVKITGEPVPDKSWKLAGKELKSTAAMTITYEDYKTKFLIVSAKRQDSGTYLIYTISVLGFDEVGARILPLCTNY